jgi:ketosteroid isomerase-like protein
VASADVEVITRMFQAWNGGDIDALLEVFDSDVEVRPALSAFLPSTAYRGHEGVAAWYAETYEPWAELQAQPQRFIDAGERTVVVVGLQARVPGGSVDLETEIAHVVTVRDGKILRLDGYEQADEALAAAGVEE